MIDTKILTKLYEEMTKEHYNKLVEQYEDTIEKLANTSANETEKIYMYCKTIVQIIEESLKLKSKEKEEGEKENVNINE